jgi:hypothetical protein
MVFLSFAFTKEFIQIHDDTIMPFLYLEIVLLKKFQIYFVLLI